MNERRVVCSEVGLRIDYGHTSIDRRRGCAHFVYDGDRKTWASGAMQVAVIGGADTCGVARRRFSLAVSSLFRVWEARDWRFVDTRQ